jgi:hypothetical protein
MGWFDKHKPVEGKTAEEQSKAEMDALVDRLGTSLEERIAKPIREELTALKTEWETVKTEATKVPPLDTTPRNADGTPRTLTAEEQARNTQQATLGVAVLTNARLTEREVLDELPTDWSHLVPEIRGLFANTPIEAKAKPDYAQYCRNCADLVIAREARKAGLRYNGESKTFFLEDKSTSATREEGVLSDPTLVWHQEKANGVTKVWTPSEQLAALGIDPKEFAESQKKGVV